MIQARSLKALSASLLVLLLQACGGGGTEAPPPEPAFTAAQADLDDALNCTPFTHPERPPVLLVHGTTTTGSEQYTLFYTPQLVALGYDVCIVTYPDRGLGDMQVSAEYIVNALRSVRAQSGRRVAMIGHSQGASMPRWALKFWPSARDAVEDFVLIAGPNHGTTVALLPTLLPTLLETLGLGALPIGTLPEALYQFVPESAFVTAVNTGDETPGDIDYSSIYTQFDELVRPVSPVATAALDAGQNNPRVANILLQDICPGYLSTHLIIGTSDPIPFALALDAINNPGPANVTRAGGPSALCGLLPVDVTALLQAPLVRGLLEIVASEFENGVPNPHLAAREPPLMPYVAAATGP